MSGEFTKRTLLEHNHDENVAHQIGDMVAEAVQRALRQLGGGAPVRQRPIGQGGIYVAHDPNWVSPAAEEVEAPVEEPNMAEPPITTSNPKPPKPAPLPKPTPPRPTPPTQKTDAQPRSGNGPVPWVF